MDVQHPRIPVREHAGSLRHVNGAELACPFIDVLEEITVNGPDMCDIVGTPKEIRGSMKLRLTTEYQSVFLTA